VSDFCCDLAVDFSPLVELHSGRVLVGL